MMFEMEVFPAVLFNRYDMKVEFDNRVAKARADVDRVQGLYPLMSEAEVAKTELSWSWISPLELKHDEAVLHELGPLMEGEGKPIFCFVKQIPYFGDELWDLAPHPLKDPPVGAIYRGSLMLQGAGHDPDEAQTQMAEELAKIERLIEEQTRRIEAFHKWLPSLIRAAVREAYLPINMTPWG